MLTTPLEIQDFAKRWHKARMAALGAQQQEADDEIQAIQALPHESRDQALRNVFDNSRKFGQSFSRHFGIVLELADFQALLPRLGITCMSGQWHRRAGSVVREKPGCIEGLKLGSFYCDYWREAVDGLTMGISDDILFARHACCRHGDDRCLDVWFEDKGETTRSLTKGALPDWAQPGLRAIVDKFKVDAVTVKFEGVCEGVLYCQITSANTPSCSDQANFEERVSREVALIWPGVRLKNTTPVAVYGEGF